MKIRSKLILMLAIPVIALAVIAFAGFRDQSAQAEENERAGEIAQGFIGLEELGLATADERLTLAEIEFATTNGDAVPVELSDWLEVATARTDAVLEDADNFAPPLGDDVVADIAEIEGMLLSARAGGDIASYTEVLARIDEVVREQPLTGFSPDSVRAVDALSNAREVTNTHESVWIEFLELTPEDVTVQQTAEIVSGFERVEVRAQAASLDTLSTGVSLNQAAATSPAFNQLSQFRALAADDLYNGTPDDLSETEVLSLLRENRNEWNDATLSASSFIESDIGTSSESIDDRRSLFTLLAVLGAFTVFTLMFVIGRSILGPLGRLMDHADKTTNERLPFAVAKLRTLGATDEIPEIRDIPRETNDEIGSLVDAFNEIQQTAVNIATDQAKSRRNVAEMFVSLGRRNQQLNHRMLNLISDLERDEQDPETLAGLYQLDHLATRMRRNAESLLVLAGNRSPRQWSRPVNMEDVVRQSLAEVELFERVEVGDLPELAMQGNVVTDVTHLLAELLDNATQFSEPSTTVQVSAQETLEGVEIEVFDEGFGIGEKDLIELNERVTNPPALDEAPSRLLGLFVVGRLAKQHGIDVSLQSQPGVGTVATVAIPNRLFAEAERPEIEAPSSALAEAPEPTVGGLDRLAGVGAGVTTEPEPDIRDQLAEANEAIAVGLPEPAAIADVAPEIAPEPTTAAEPTIAPELAVLPLPEVAEPEVPEPAVAETGLQLQMAEPFAEPVAEVPEPIEPEPGPAFEALESPAPAVEVSAPEATAPAVDIDEAVPAWDPAAVHEEQLADASMPTMQEVEEALPAFPGVTIDEPTVSAVPAAPVVSDDTWPLTKLEAPEAPAEPSLVDIDQLPAAEVAAPEMPAEAAPAQIVDPAPAPAQPEAAPAQIAESVPTQPEAVPTQPEAVPTQPEAVPTQSEAVAPSLPQPPVVNEPQLPAPPIVEAQEPVAEMPQPEVWQAPESPTSTFGGLPTRSPQAALEEASQTPSVIPLAGGRDLETEAKPSNPGAFAAFASGVNRGLDKVRDAPKPNFSTEGENE